MVIIIKERPYHMEHCHSSLVWVSVVPCFFRVVPCQTAREKIKTLISCIVLFLCHLCEIAYLKTYLKGCPTNRISLILSSNLLSQRDGCAANKLDKTLLENVVKFSAFKDSHSLARVDDKLK